MQKEIKILLITAFLSAAVYFLPHAEFSSVILFLPAVIICGFFSSVRLPGQSKKIKPAAPDVEENIPAESEDYSTAIMPAEYEIPEDNSLQSPAVNQSENVVQTPPVINEEEPAPALQEEADNKPVIPAEAAELHYTTAPQLDNFNSYQELLESNKRFQLALETSEIGFADINLKDLKVYFSPIYLKILGYSAEELTGMVPKWHNYIHLEDIDPIRDGIKDVLSGKVSSIDSTARVLTKGGHWKWFSVKIKTAEKDNFDRLIIIIEDITLRKAAEEEMLNNLAKEQELAEVRSRLVTLVSHEFRTPISTILSSIELVETYGDTLSKDKVANYYKKIKNSIDYLTSLLNEISLMGKAESGALFFKPQKVELAGYIAELIDEIKGIFKVHPKIHFNCNRKHFKSEYDLKLLRYIFHNLLVNAIKYTPAEKNVYIYCIFTPGEFYFSITDEGIGIPKAEQKNLFDPFMRCSNVGDIKGSGLGLSIVKKTIEVCRGKISYVSEVNKGTSFKISLPLVNVNS